MEGYIIINRLILNWEWYDHTNTFRLFSHLLLKASYQDSSWKGINVKRGQIITSLDSLVKETGLSLQNIRTGLNNLKKSNDLTESKHGKARIITIVSYDKFTSSNRTVTENQQLTNNTSTKHQQEDNSKVTTSKEYKEDIKKDNLKVIKKSKLKSSKIQVERDANDFAIIPNDYFQYSKELGLSEEAIHHEFNRFANYYESISGSKSKRDNWYRAWQSWLTSPYSKGSQSKNNSGNSTTSAIGKVTNELRGHPIASFERPKSAYSDI